MTTSLQKQLQKLTVPQSSQFKHRKSRASLLYDSREAALLDRDTVFLLGCDGFDQLVALDSSFISFREHLFSSGVKDLQRTVLTREDNKRIDSVIDQFLCHLSSYLLLKPAQKALEWLVYRFHVHEYNVDALLRCAFPYHESPLFVRVVQLLELRKSSARWHWLQCLQKPGVPLTKQALYTQCARDIGLLNFICNMNKKVIEVLGSEARGLSAAITFYISAVSGMLRSLATSGVNESQMALLSAHLLRGLRSASSPRELRAGSCLLLMQLTGVAHQGAPLAAKFCRVLFNVLTKNASGELSALYIGTLAVLARGQALNVAPIVAVRHFCRHSANLVPVLASLSQHRSPLELLLCLIRGAINLAIDDCNDDAVALVTRLVDDVSLPSTSDQCLVINVLFGVYTGAANSNSSRSKDDDGDGDEDSDDDDDDDEMMDCSNTNDAATKTAARIERCVVVVCQPLQLMRRRYPVAWQQSLQAATNKNTPATSINGETTAVDGQDSVAQSILKLIAAIDGPLHSGHLLELLHPHEATRQLAAQTVFQQLREEKCLESVDADRMSVYREAVISCLTLSADCIQLVSMVLRVPAETLTALVGADKLIELLSGYLNSMTSTVLDLSTTTTTTITTTPMTAVGFDATTCRLCAYTLCSVLSLRGKNVSTDVIGATPLSLLCTLLAMVPLDFIELKQGSPIDSSKEDDGIYLKACHKLFLDLPECSDSVSCLTSLSHCMALRMTSSMVSRLVMTLARGAGHYHTTDKLLQRLQLSSAALAASYTSSAVEDIADARLIVNSLVEVLKCQTDNTRAVPKAKHRALNADISVADILLLLTSTDDIDQSSAPQLSELILCIVNAVVLLCSKHKGTSDEWLHLLLQLFCTSADCLAVCRSRCRPFYQAIIKSILPATINTQADSAIDADKLLQKLAVQNQLYDQLMFLSAVWTDCGIGGCHGNESISDASRLTALLAANALVRGSKQTALMPSIVIERNYSLLCSALVALMSPVSQIRETGMALCVSYIPPGSKNQLTQPHDKSLPGLVARLHKISDDIKLNASALSQWLQSRARSCYVHAVLESICQPADGQMRLTSDVIYQLLRCLAPAVHRLDDTALSTALTLASPSLNSVSANTEAKALSDTERHLLSAQLSLFTASAARGLHRSSVWSVFSAALHCHSQCVQSGSDGGISPHQLIISSLTDAFVSVLDENIQRNLANELMSILCADSVSENVSTNAKLVLARLPTAASLLADFIQQMLPTACSSVKEACHSRRKESTLASDDSTNAPEIISLTPQQCRRLTVVLETIQLLCSSLSTSGDRSNDVPSQRRAQTDHADKLIAPLFGLLHQLQQQQQVQLLSVEQPEQLPSEDKSQHLSSGDKFQELSSEDKSQNLSSEDKSQQLQLLAVATVQLVVSACSDKQLAAAGGRLCVDTLVQTVRHSSSVHVHRHALHVLCRIANVLPDVVLHSVMSVFTFVGSSLLRQDNDFTFSIIEQTLDTVIPAVIRARSVDSNVPVTAAGSSSVIGHQGGATDDTAILTAFLPVLRVFCDAACDIPRHRRVPLFVRLLRGADSGGAPRHLWRAVALFMAQQTTVVSANQRAVSLTKGRHGNASTNKTDEVSEQCDMAMSVCAQFDVNVQLDVVYQLLLMVSTILHTKLDFDESDSESVSGSDSPHVSNYSALFDLDHHTDNQSYRFCINCVSFAAHLLASDTFIGQNERYRTGSDNEDDGTDQLQTSCDQYQLLFQTVVSLVNSCSGYTKAADKRLSSEQLKFARVLLVRVTDLLDKMNCRLPASLFIDTVCGLLSRQPPLHASLRRKTIELLAVRVQHQLQYNQQQQQLSIEPFSAQHTPKLLNVLDELTRCVESCSSSSDTEAVNGSCAVVPPDGGVSDRECVVSGQTALYAIKLLAKLLAEENAQHFISVMEIVLKTITSLISSTGTSSSNMNGHSDLPPILSPPLLSSALLCLAQLCASLGARAVVHVTQTATVLLTVLAHSALVSKELVALSAITAVHKLIGALSPFLSPHLPDLLLHVCHLSVEHGTKTSSTGAIASNIQVRLRQARSQLAAICLRLFLPAVDDCLQQLSLEGATTVPAHYSALCSILTECLVETEMAQITSNIASIQNIVLRLLDCRCLCAGLTSSSSLPTPSNAIDRLENDVIHLMTSLVPRLSENSFRPFFLRVQEWALGESTAAVWKVRRDCQQNGGQHSDDESMVNGNAEESGIVGERVVTFFRLADALAETLRGLFVLFAGQFFDQLATVIEVNCSSKQNGVHPVLPDSEVLKCQLALSSIDCLNKLCIHDTEEFINANRFQRMMQPLIDQFENELGSPQERSRRVTGHLVPCIVNFLLAPGDDTLWKTAHYQLLLKLRHSSAQVRLHVLECLAALVTRLQDDYSSLLPETVSFFGELLEDEDERVELACQQLVKQLEHALGESLQKYF